MLHTSHSNSLPSSHKPHLWFFLGMIFIACSADAGEAVASLENEVDVRQEGETIARLDGEAVPRQENKLTDNASEEMMQPAGTSPGASPGTSVGTSPGTSVGTSVGASAGRYLPAPAGMPFGDMLQEETLSAIYELYAPYDRADAPGCAVGIYQNGDMVFSGAFGAANLDYGIPLSDSSRFYMASVSKQVTAAAAGLLVVRGLLDYEARVSDYLGNWPQWAGEVRVKHLFNHTSGLPDIYDLMDIAGISLSNVMDIEDYMSVFFNGESLKNSPGAAFSYTNSGYTTLARLVEVVTGEDFSVFVEKELLNPIGMTATHFHDDRTRVIPNRVISYAPLADLADAFDEDGGASQERSQELPVVPFRQTYLSNFQGVGPGGLYSSIRDWRHWEAFWSGDMELPDEFSRLRLMMTDREVARGDTLDYAMGLDVEKWQGLWMMGHSGNFMGFRTDVRRFPQTGLALLTLCNRDDSNPAQMNRSLAKILLKDLFEAFLMPYEGTYHNEELLADFGLSVEDGTLNLSRRLSPNGAMSEEALDKWRAGSWLLEFQRDDRGEITGLLVTTGRARNVEFIRK